MEVYPEIINLVSSECLYYVKMSLIMLKRKCTKYMESKLHHNLSILIKEMTRR